MYSTGRPIWTLLLCVLLTCVPSELAVAAGVHTIAISKHGYKPWERKLTVSSGKVTVAAELEQ